MNPLEMRIVIVDILSAFTAGCAVPLCTPEKHYVPLYLDLAALVGNTPLGITLATLAAGIMSGGVCYYTVLRIRGWSRAMRLLLKVSLFGLPAVAAGNILCVGLASLGLAEVPAHLVPIWSVIAANNLIGGVAGIAAMRSTPEYRCILGPKTTTS